MAAAATAAANSPAPTPAAGSKHKAADATQGAADAKQPAKKKRRTKSHIQPDATIHPTGTPLSILEAQAAAAAGGSAAPAEAGANHGTAAASASHAAQASSTAAAAADATAMTDDAGTNGSAEHAKPPSNVQVHVHPPALSVAGSTSPTVRDSPNAAAGAGAGAGAGAAGGAAAAAAGAATGAAAAGGTPKLETKKASKLRKKKEQKTAKTVATAVATAQAAAASASKAAANAAAAQAAAEKLVAAAAAPAATAGAGAGAAGAAGAGGAAAQGPPATPTGAAAAAAAVPGSGPKPKGPAAVKRAEEKAQDKAKDQHEVATDQIKKKMSGLDAKVVSGDTFESENHFYPRVLNSNIHPMVANFLRLGNDRIAARYCHLNPKVKEDKLKKILADCPKVFRWSGADLFNVTTVSGQRQMIIVETNSCPSGQKSMPLVSEEETADGYHKLMRTTFLPTVAEMERKGELPKGGLAVIYDKNPMEASGYAAALAALSKEPVMLAEFYETDSDPPVKWIDGVTHIRDEEKKWHPMRACFRYVTQRPWNRIPTESKTLIFNPVVACLAGGRNKMAADKAYELFNHMIAETGLKIRTPETIRDVAKEMVPLWVASMGGHAVVKVPYSNAGQGVYTIVNDEELKAFMESPQRYDKYIVQSLVGNSTWSSITRSGQYFHAGTIPNKKCETFAADLRVMVAGGPLTGFTPVAVYARRAEKPLAHKLDHSEDSWAMLGTNLSVKLPDGGWTTETERLLLMDMKDFNRLGIGTDDLIDAYVQTVLATTAIDRLAIQLVKNQKFDFMLYRSLNSDESLLREIYLGHQRYNLPGPAPAAAAGAGAGPGPYPPVGAVAAAVGPHAPAAAAAGGASTTATHER